MRLTRLGLIVSAAILASVAGSFVCHGPGRPERLAHADPDRLRVVDRRDGDQISVTFDRPMVEPEAIGGAAPLEVDLPGRAVWETLSRAAFRRTGPLPPGRTVTVRLGSVASLDGKRLEEPVRWTFRTAGFAVSGGTLPGTTGPLPRFALRFNRPVEPTELERHARFEGEGKVLAAFLIGDAIVPESPLPLGTAWRLAIDPDLHSEDGLRLEAPWRHSFNVAPAQEVVEATGVAYLHATNELRLRFRNPVIEKDLRGRISVQPRVEFVASAWAETATLHGDFKAGATYWVHLREGSTDLYGNRMEAATATVQVPSYAPSVRLEERRPYLERSASPSVPLECVNAPEVRVTVFRLEARPWAKQEGDRAYERVLAGNSEPDEIFTHGVALPGAGLYRVEAVAPAVRQSASAVYQVTDLALSFKLGRERSLACVTSFDSAHGAEDVRLSLHGAKGEVLWTGRTGTDGCAEAPGRAELRAGPRWLVAATSDDQAWLDLSRAEMATWRFSSEARRPADPEPLDLFLHTDRPLYRPGETVHVKGWWGSRPGSDARLEFENPRGDVLEARTCAASPAGGIDASFRLGSHAPTGTYRVRARAGDRRVDHAVEVGSYRSPSFEVRVRTSAPHFFPKQRFEATVEARAFFGAPLADAYVQWHARIEERGEHASGEGKLDVDGRFTIAYPLGTGTGPLTLWATVTDSANQSISAEAVVPVHPSAVRIEATAPSPHGEAGNPLPLEIAVRTVEGATDSRDVSLRLIRRTWSSVQQLTAGRGWSYVREKRDTLVAAEIVQPGKIAPTPMEPGIHVVELRTRDDAGREAFQSLEFEVTGAGEAGWFYRDDQRVELSTDKALYAPGEVARLFVRHAPPGSRALVTLEREGVLDRQWHFLQESTGVIEVPLDARSAPNVHVGLLVFRGRTERGLNAVGEDGGRPRMRMGYVELRIDTSAQRLPVHVNVSPRFRPGEEGALDIQTAPGAEVSVAVVDEAVLSLVERADPDPHAFFRGPKPLRVATYEARPDLAALRPLDVRGKKGRPGGGGGDDKSVVRRNFSSSAFWSPCLRADEQGRVSVRFRLPDNVTRWRVIAVAGTGDRWGTGHARFETDKPLMIVPALPRFALLGDSFSARYVVHNRTSESGRVRVELEKEVREMEVERGKSIACDFPVRAERLGPWRFRARATLGKFEDVVETTIQVAFPAAGESETVSGWARGPKEIVPPAFDRVESSVLTLGSNEGALLDSELRRLLEYPNGCVEQTTSKTLPLLAMERIGVEGARERAAKGVERLLSMQTLSGGLAYWPGGSDPHPSGTVYAAHALVLAEKRGFAVPRPALDRALDYVEARLREPDSIRRSYAVYVLALAGRRHEAYVEALPPDPYLALAALEMGKLTRARTLLQPSGEISLRKTGEFESDVRTMAVRVMVRARLGEDPGISAADLVRRAVVTYEQAWTLLAAGELIGSRSEARQVKVFVEGTLIAERTVDGVERMELPPGRVRIETDGRTFYALRVRGFRKGTEGSGFWVRRTFSRAGESEPRAEFQAGDLVVARVSVYVNSDRSYVALDDPLPAGFEPVDLRFRTEVGSFVGVNDFSHVDRKDDRVFASRERMGQGLYELVYLARATTVGDFAAPAPRAEEMYSPEVKGRGSDARIRVSPR